MGTDLALRGIGALATAAAATALAIRYARRRSMLDLPGQRRSHSLPTPRGGGIGIVIAVLGYALPLLPLALTQQLVLAAALAAVAGIGWWDDHRPLSARARLAVQALAAVLLVWLLGQVADVSALSAPMLITAAGLVVLSTLWAINLHNFMDGINGLLALQSAWVFSMVALIGAFLPHGLGPAPLLMAAACLGFLPFNFPRARIFLGDVGSGALGFLIAAVLWLAAARDLRWLPVGLLLTSSFCIDATATLLHRMRRGRRWYSAHREHLYQWLARRGWSHARIVSAYMAWNIFLIAPLALFTGHSDDPMAGVVCVAAAYATGLLIWRRSRRAILRRVRAHA